MKVADIKNITIILIILPFFYSCEKNKDNLYLPFKPHIKENVEQESQSFGVITVNRLRMRSDNDIHSKTIMYLDKGEIVTVLKKNGEKVKVGEVEDYWYQIEYNGTKGWIFGYFFDIYQSPEDAKTSAREIKSLEASNTLEKGLSPIDQQSIDKNLFFLKSGRLYQLLNFKTKEIKKINTYQDYNITDYFFSSDGSSIFYISKRNQNDNGILYIYNLKNNTNQIVENNVFAADINEKNNFLFLLSKNRYWYISSRDSNAKANLRIITKFNISKEMEILKADIFSQTMARERSSLVYFKYNGAENIIYFKPPAEKETYVISANSGEHIKTEKEKDTNFYIDSSQYLSVTSSEDTKGGIVYSIILNDKFSGRQKDMVTSSLYPAGFSLSPKKNYLSVTMLDLNKIIDGSFYHSSIHILSLDSYVLYPVSTDGRSYLSKWSSKRIN
jgi:Bacterial SH3 domain